MLLENYGVPNKVVQSLDGTGLLHPELWNSKVDLKSLLRSGLIKHTYSPSVPNSLLTFSDLEAS